MFATSRGATVRSVRTLLRQNGPIPLSRISSRSRLLSTLAILEQREGKLNVSSLAAVAAAQKLGASVTGFIAGSGTKAVAEQAAKVKGLEKVVFVDNGAYDKVRFQLTGLVWST